MPDIINPFQTQPKPLPTLAERRAEEIIHAASILPDVMVSTHQRIYNMLWVDSLKEGITPQQILDAIGTKSAALFQRGGQVVDFLRDTGIAVMTPDEYAPKQAPTFNPDGTVTLAPVVL